MKSLMMCCIALSLLVACGRKGGGPNLETDSEVIYVDNALNYIKGTTNNTEYKLPRKWRNALKTDRVVNLYLTKVAAIVSSRTPESQRAFNVSSLSHKHNHGHLNDGDIRDGQRPTDEDETKKKLDKYMLILNDGKLTLSSSDYQKLSLTLDLDSKRNTLYFKDDDEYISGNLVHFSLANDQKSFSLLFKYRNKCEECSDEHYDLASFTFTTQADAKVSRTDSESKYKYLYGPGVRVRWNDSENLNVHYCADDNYDYTVSLTEAQMAARKWSEVSSKLNVKVRKLKKYPPFSDLNTHCIYLVDDFQTIASKSSANPAVALTTPRQHTKEIIDSDIFFFKKELKKLRDNYDVIRYDRDTRQTMIHEMGHMLGLHHQFDGTKSIMSYKNLPAYLGLTTYDEDAIKLLYEDEDSDDDSVQDDDESSDESSDEVSNEDEIKLPEVTESGVTESEEHHQH